MTEQPTIAVSAVTVTVPTPAGTVALEVGPNSCRVWSSRDCATVYQFSDQTTPPGIFHGPGDLLNVPHFDDVYRYLVAQLIAHRTNPLGRFLAPLLEAIDSALAERDGTRVYYAAAGNWIKIGCSRDVAARIAQLQTGNGERVRLLATEPGGRAQERQIHERFAGARGEGEWFAPTPALLAHIQGLA